MNQFFGRVFGLVAIGVILTSQAGKLVINYNDPNPAPKKGFDQMIESFKASTSYW